MKNNFHLFSPGRKITSPKFLPLILLFGLLLTCNGSYAQFLTRLFGDNDYIYPPFPTSFAGLDKNDTKYLSNASYPSLYYGGDHVFVSGWSSNTDGGFTAGTMDALSVYTGTATVQLLDKIDVQVGFLEGMGNTYIIASYFNNSTSNYGFSLYTFNAGTATFVYDYEFLDPSYPNMPISGLSTMTHNRISMDVNRDGDKVVFALTDGASSRMFGAVGVLDAVNSRIILNATNFVTTVSASSGGCDISDCPWPSGWDMNILGYDTISPGINYCPSGNWVVNTLNFTNPLIEIQAQRTVPSTSTTRYQQLFAEVAFSGDYIDFAFYCPGASIGSSAGLDEIYIIPDIPFIDFFTQTGTCSNVVQEGALGNGATWIAGSPCIHPQYWAHQFIAYHTTDFLSTAEIRDASGGGGWPTTDPLLPSGDVWFNMDMPDTYTGEWALTFKDERTAGSNLILARYNDLSGTNKYAYVNDMSLGHAPIETYSNDDPDIAYNDAGDQLNVIWGSEGSALFATTNRKSLLGVVINIPSGPPPLALTGDYLVVTKYPDLDFGSVKVLSALSKRSDNMVGLYTSFCQTQDDLGTLTFSIFHNQHNWAGTSSSWKTTKEDLIDPGADDKTTVNVTPNPFQNSIQFRSNNSSDFFSVGLFDQVGRRLYNTTGNSLQLNNYFENKLTNLQSGMYMIKVTDKNGRTTTRKMIKEQ